MSDTEALDLIQHYGWGLRKEPNGWTVYSAHFVTHDHDTVRDAIKDAMRMQMKWATKPLVAL